MVVPVITQSTEKACLCLLEMSHLTAELMLPLCSRL